MLMYSNSMYSVPMSVEACMNELSVLISSNIKQSCVSRKIVKIMLKETKAASVPFLTDFKRGGYQFV